MKQLKRSLLAKTVAVVLLVLSAAVFALSAIDIAYMSYDGFYDRSSAFSQSAIARELSGSYAREAFFHYYYTTYEPEVTSSIDLAPEALNTERTNFIYGIFDESDTMVDSNAFSREAELRAAVKSGKELYSGKFSMNFSGMSAESRQSFTVSAILASPVEDKSDAFYSASRVFSFAYRMRYAAFAVCAAALTAFALLLAFLISAAGWREAGDAPQRGFFDRIPFDLCLAGTGGLIALLCYGAYSASSESAFLLSLLVLALCALCTGLLLLCLLLSFAVRVKTKTFWRNNVIFFVLHAGWVFLRWLLRGVAAVFSKLPLLWKWFAFAAGLALAEALLIAGAPRNSFSAFLFVVFNLALFVLYTAVALQLSRIKKAGKALAEGKLDYQLATAGMFGDIKRHAEALNSIGTGMGRAVEARMKSERMKTDLITNVSHDLKTPLTSIVNYVDLLKKEALPEGAAREYVEVLDRQAQRLKKLTEDLVEASKATSGTLAVELMPTDMREILSQSLGEYERRMIDADLTVVASLPETPLPILADGRLLWRVFDNLLSNAAKYALPGTRVYVAASGDGASVSASVKNISRDALNRPPEELMERFVRGDEARSTGGSGLGLSIAKSLTELQGGAFTLAIDGDLFTATVTFPAR